MEQESTKPGKPAKPHFYQSAIALEFFKSAGKTEKFAPGKSIFAENEGAAGLFSNGARMYLLLAGEVTLTVKKKVIGTVTEGEVFGEMASISQLPRTATATAKTACSVIALDEKQFQRAVERSPEFALMMMALIIGRLRETVAKVTGKLSEQDRWSKGTVFDRKLLADLQHELSEKPPALHHLNKVIMKEGDKGVFMYVVLEGVVSVTIQDKPVEKIGPGGVFGEMALVDQSARVATATAETDCMLLAINRNDFMNLVRTRPAFATSLMKALAERLRFMTSKYQ